MNDTHNSGPELGDGNGMSERFASFRFTVVEQALKHMSSQLDSQRSRLDELHVSLEIVKSTLASTPRPGQSDMCSHHSATMAETAKTINALETRMEAKIDAQSTTIEDIKRKFWMASGALLAVNGLITFLPAIIRMLHSVPSGVPGKP